MKGGEVLLIFFLVLIAFASISFAYDLITADSREIMPGEKLVITLNPGAFGIYREAFIYKNKSLVAAVDLDCNGVCYEKKEVSYIIPAYWHGGHTLYLFDYGINDYLKQDFFVTDKVKKVEQVEDERNYSSYIVELKQPSVAEYNKQFLREIEEKQEKIEKLKIEQARNILGVLMQLNEEEKTSMAKAA